MSRVQVRTCLSFLSLCRQRGEDAVLSAVLFVRASGFSIVESQVTRRELVRLPAAWFRLRSRSRSARVTDPPRFRRLAARRSKHEAGRSVIVAHGPRPLGRETDVGRVPRHILAQVSTSGPTFPIPPSRPLPLHNAGPPPAPDVPAFPSSSEKFTGPSGLPHRIIDFQK